MRKASSADANDAKNVELFRMQGAKAAGIYKLLPPKPYTCPGVRTLSTRLGMPKHGHESLDASRACCNTAGYRGSLDEAVSALIHDLLHAPDQALHQGMAHIYYREDYGDFGIGISVSNVQLDVAPVESRDSTIPASETTRKWIRCSSAVFSN
ncbi:uncharacterized protein LOC124697780 [Lolium rigidum]|uniref:uncharacterized protein LOC124697780 n=1 Tax=Lolium rigidum TaxID=89674 RepID=UPI001F5D2FF9|nr:uncharacterized protein LOC124697780 [Lolium rigidum]XP_047086287.1 uncharacterized protein LOC124697780 [Lolium rigidum]